MSIISVINYKGGVGKTTITANLSAELAFRGYKVLMIDLDPQASLTFSFIKPDIFEKKYATGKTIKDWFKPSKKSPVTHFSELVIPIRKFNNSGTLNLIASHLDLINVDLELATQLGGANMQQSKQRFLKVHSSLKNGIGQLNDDQYDYIFIDCPPNFNIVTKNAIIACEKVLIPAKPDYLSTLGIDYLQRSFKQLILDFNAYCEVEDDDDIEKINPKIEGVVFTMVQFYGNQPIAASRPYIAQTKRLGVSVFSNIIRENKTMYTNAPQEGTPVILTNDYRPDIVRELEDFVDEFFDRVKP